MRHTTMDKDYLQKITSTASIAIIAIVAALALLGIVAVTTVAIPLQQQAKQQNHLQASELVSLKTHQRSSVIDR
jgi:uncharacterized membrane protein YjgN (DUF898 family)